MHLLKNPIFQMSHKKSHPNFEDDEARERKVAKDGMLLNRQRSFEQDKEHRDRDIVTSEGLELGHKNPWDP